MAKFECSSCGKVFLYPAKITSLMVHDPEKPGEYLAVPTDTTGFEPTVERHVCPYCSSLDIKEHQEPLQVEKIVSGKSVELEKVDEWIGKGYEVKELYAKTATMIKKSHEGENVTVEGAPEKTELKA